jgi:hypothetical protein
VTSDKNWLEINMHSAAMILIEAKQEQYGDWVMGCPAVLQLGAA